MSTSNAKPLSVATICHHDDDPTDPKRRRVRVFLNRTPEGLYGWNTESGEDCGIGHHECRYDAGRAALEAWHSPARDFEPTVMVDARAAMATACEGLGLDPDVLLNPRTLPRTLFLAIILGWVSPEELRTQAELIASMRRGFSGDIH